MSSETLWYFGYGSNLCRAIFVERRGMQPLAARPARLDDFGLRFDIPIGRGERGVANLACEPGAFTWGAAYLLSTTDCERLDRTEGVHAGVYRRVPVTVVTTDGERLTAFTYQSPLTPAARKPSPRYLGLLLTGAREHALPAEWLAFLQSFELAVDERVAG